MLIRLLTLFTIAISINAYADIPEWVNAISISGDMRLRYDFLKKQSPANTPDRHRNQIRARLLTEARPIEDISVGFRIATGDSSNVLTSNNTTMDDAGKDKPLWVDQAYVAWKPNDITKVIGGKMENPFYAVSRQLVFDADLTPEGIANTNKLPNGLFANAGAFWIEERSSGASSATEPGYGPGDAGLFAAQVGWAGDLGNATWAFGVADYYIGGLKNKPLLNGARGNTTRTADNGTLLYANDFGMLNPFVEVSFGSVGLFIDLVQNTSTSKQNQAFLAGARYGKIKEKGDWVVSYSYRKTEKDAVVGALKDSDFADGVNDSRGHQFTARYALAPKSYVEVYAALAEVEISATAKKTDRYMADLSIAF